MECILKNKHILNINSDLEKRRLINSLDLESVEVNYEKN